MELELGMAPCLRNPDGINGAMIDVRVSSTEIIDFFFSLNMEHGCGIMSITQLYVFIRIAKELVNVKRCNMVVSIS